MHYQLYGFILLAQLGKLQKQLTDYSPHINVSFASHSDQGAAVRSSRHISALHSEEYS